MKGKNKSLDRKPGTATEAQTIAIICEGTVTEHIYFEGIRKHLRLPTAEILVAGLGCDPVAVVKKAQTQVGKYDQVWAVFDVEAPKPHARLNDALALAKSLNIPCAIPPGQRHRAQSLDHGSQSGEPAAEAPAIVVARPVACSPTNRRNCPDPSR